MSRDEITTAKLRSARLVWRTDLDGPSRGPCNGVRSGTADNPRTPAAVRIALARGRPIKPLAAGRRRGISSTLIRLEALPKRWNSTVIKITVFFFDLEGG